MDSVLNPFRSVKSVVSAADSGLPPLPQRPPVKSNSGLTRRSSRRLTAVPDAPTGRKFGGQLSVGSYGAHLFPSPDGGIGRRAGLKILWITSVSVRPRLRAPAFAPALREAPAGTASRGEPRSGVRRLPVPQSRDEGGPGTSSAKDGGMASTGSTVIRRWSPPSSPFLGNKNAKQGQKSLNHSH